MEIKFENFDDFVIAHLKGELDEFTAEHVRLSLDTILEDMKSLGSSKLVLDFKDVDFMDSTGIGVLLARYNKFSKFGVRIEIKNAIGHIDKILKMSGIYEIMPKLAV
ncbi:MAG: STAS domain-containing protein [bacterium]|nr:STAS domain-containing protein [bacterium]